MHVSEDREELNQVGARACASLSVPIVLHTVLEQPAEMIANALPGQLFVTPEILVKIVVDFDLRHVDEAAAADRVARG